MEHTRQSLEREADEIEQRAQEYLEEHPDDFDDMYLTYQQLTVTHLRSMACNAPEERDTRDWLVGVHAPYGKE